MKAKDVRAIYVTDVAQAADPRKPDLTVWIEARKAWYVVGSRQRGGMGEAEPFPFGDEAAARRFAADNGGAIKRFAEVTEDEILHPTLPSEQTASDEGMEHGGGNHGGGHGGTP